MTTNRDPLRFLNASSATDLVARLLQYAHDAMASDIHLVPVDDGLEVLIRCDGELTKIGMVHRDLRATVIGRFKVLADLLVYRTDIPQEGRIPRERTGIQSDVRVASYPALLGEKVAVRLDARRERALELDGLGLSETTRAELVHALEQPEGVILLTGPSGSGKTTTLYSCLQHLVQGDRRRSVVTVEDPVERRIDGVVQTEINEIAGLTYGAALRAILRQDPEVILVGEIRDHVTAAMALEAGLTGHLIASTVHAGSAPQVFTRLMEMDIEPFAITSVVRGVLSQRLLRKRCPAQDAPALDATALDAPALDAPAKLDHSNCTHCNGSGFNGRVLVAEWLPMSDPLRRAILARSDCDALAAAAAESGYQNLRAAAQELVNNEITTQQEVDRVLGSDPNPIPADLGEHSGGSHPLSPNPGGDVSRRSAPPQGASPVVPRPQPGSASRRIGGDGGGSRGGNRSGGGVREAASALAEAVPGADPGGDRQR